VEGTRWGESILFINESDPLFVKADVIWMVLEASNRQAFEDVLEEAGW